MLRFSQNTSTSLLLSVLGMLKLAQTWFNYLMQVLSLIGLRDFMMSYLYKAQ